MCVCLCAFLFSLLDQQAPFISRCTLMGMTFQFLRFYFWYWIIFTSNLWLHGEHFTLIYCKCSKNVLVRYNRGQEWQLVFVFGVTILMIDLLQSLFCVVVTRHDILKIFHLQSRCFSRPSEKSINCNFLIQYTHIHDFKYMIYRNIISFPILQTNSTNQNHY